MADLNDIYHRLGAIQADQTTMKHDISEIKTQVKEVRDFKIRVVTWCVAASAGITVLISLAKAALASTIGGNNGSS